MPLDGEIILITGTNGFLGRSLAKNLSRRGAEIYGIGHGDFSSVEMSEIGIKAYKSSEINLSSLLKICKKPNKIIHCASSSSVSYSVSHPKEDFEKTVNSTLSVLEFMRLYAKDAQLVIPSSAAVYGQKEKKPISVDDVLNPISPYGNNKKICETISKFYSNNYDLRISVVRFFSLYGPGLKKQLFWDACNKIKEGNHIYSGTGLETRDWLYIDDAVELIILALKNASTYPEVINGGSGRSFSIKEVLYLLYEMMSVDIVPQFSGLAKEGDPFFYEAEMKKALSWGWEPKIDLTDGISEFVKWFKSLDL